MIDKVRGGLRHVPAIAGRANPAPLIPATSLAVGKRAAGSLARSRRVSPANQAGRSGFARRTSVGSMSVTIRSTAWLYSARNGGLAVAIVNNTAPSANRSLRASTGLPSACSGDM